MSVTIAFDHDQLGFTFATAGRLDSRGVKNGRYFYRADSQHGSDGPTYKNRWELAVYDRGPSSASPTMSFLGNGFAGVNRVRYGDVIVNPYNPSLAVSLGSWIDVATGEGTFRSAAAIHVLDLTNPAAPAYVATTRQQPSDPTFNFAHAFSAPAWVDATKLLVLHRVTDNNSPGSRQWWELLDYSTPTAPTLLSSTPISYTNAGGVDFNASFWTVPVRDGDVFTWLASLSGESGSRWFHIDVSNPAAITETIGAFAPKNSAGTGVSITQLYPQSTAHLGRYRYDTHSQSGDAFIDVVDFATPTAPAYANGPNGTDTGRDTNGIGAFDVGDGHVWASFSAQFTSSADQYLNAWDLSNPIAPAMDGDFFGCHTSSFDASNRYLTHDATNRLYKWLGVFYENGHLYVPIGFTFSTASGGSGRYGYEVYSVAELIVVPIIGRLSVG